MVTQIPQLIKATSIIGHKVVTLDTGSEVGEINEIIYDPELNQVKALQIKGGGLIADPRLILLIDVKSIGRDALIIDSSEAIRKASDVHDSIAKIAKNNTYLTDTNIMTEDGNALGKIVDIYFDFPTGNVIEFEVSSGALKDIKSGKKKFKIEDVITIGKDATIVRTYTQEQFKQQEQTQGFQGAVNRVRDESPFLVNRIRDKVNDLGENIRQKSEDLSRKTQEFKDSPQTNEKLDTLKARAEKLVSESREKINDTKRNMIEAKKQDAVGKYVTMTILGPNDEKLAYAGDLITNHLIQEAENLGVLDKVLNNVSPKSTSFEETPVVHLSPKIQERQ